MLVSMAKHGAEVLRGAADATFRRIQWRTHWSGWGFGEGQERPIPKRYETATFRWFWFGSRPGLNHRLGGYNGGEHRPLVQFAGTTPHNWPLPLFLIWPDSCFRASKEPHKS